MSTKASLNYHVDEASGTSAHVYEECLAPADFPVYLEISAVPRALAAKLGLLPTRKKQE